MAKTKKKRALVIIIALVALLVIIGIAAALGALGGKEKDPFVQKNQDTSNTSSTSSPDSTDSKPSEKNVTPVQPDMDNDAKSLDPATVSTITIEPMKIVVSYVKGAGGFSYNVNRTADGRQSVDFSSESLVGTKCTNDTGVFASILESPNDNEKATLSKTIVVSGTPYGLSIASDTCTSDSTSLKKYQDSFSKAFSLLKKAE